MGKRLGICAAAGIAGAAGIVASTRYANKHKLSADELDIALLGDSLFDTSREAVLEGDAIAVHIDAPADTVWAHIKQMGQDRAGLYSFERLERLFTIDIHNHYTIHPEWQERNQGDFMRLYQPPLNLGFEVRKIDEEKRQMVLWSDSRKHPTDPAGRFIAIPHVFDYLAVVWSFAAIESKEGGTLFMTKAKLGFSPSTPAHRMMMAAAMFGHDFMQTGQCDLLKAVCEGRITIDQAHI